jgi:hypothetical protein
MTIIQINPTLMRGWFYAIRAGVTTDNGRKTYWAENHEGERRELTGAQFHILLKRHNEAAGY